MRKYAVAYRWLTRLHRSSTWESMLAKATWNEAQHLRSPSRPLATFEWGKNAGNLLWSQGKGQRHVSFNQSRTRQATSSARGKNACTHEWLCRPKRSFQSSQSFWWLVTRPSRAWLRLLIKAGKRLAYDKSAEKWQTCHLSLELARRATLTFDPSGGLADDQKSDKYTRTLILRHLRSVQPKNKTFHIL